MKKYIFLFSVVVFFVLAGCGEGNRSKEQFVSLIPEEVTEMTVTHIRSGEETEYMIDGAKLDEMKNWASHLSMKHKVYKDGSTPGDMDGGEVYSFHMEGEYTEFSYIINGKNDCYILMGDEWYAVSNPTDPFEEGGLKSIGAQNQWDRIPMLMVDGELYLDTGKETPIDAVDSISGEIVSTVDGTEKPTENGQSNFGCVGSRYVLQDDCAVVNIDDTWIIFEKESSEETVLSLDTVLELSKKGNSLTWSDFEQYNSTDIGSGLYILRYDIDSNFYLLIGGGGKELPPMYIRLVKTSDESDWIDIREGDVENFISK